MSHPTITLEEHFLSSNVEASVGPSLARLYRTLSPGWRAKLTDISPAGSRVRAMDAGGISVQVLSNSFGVSSTDPAAVSAGNDELAAAVSTQPQQRFRGFAALPMKDPVAAAAELRRCVGEFGFVGALVDSHLDDGRYYDDVAHYAPLFRAFQELGVPMYIHPTVPVDAIFDALYRPTPVQGSSSGTSYDARLAMLLGAGAWGWHCDTGLSVLRMYAGGVFDAFPGLRVVVGHMGEMLPYMIDRTDEKLKQMMDGREGVPETRFRQVWERNIWVTTSGMFTLAPMACLLKTTKIDKILYSVDYPYSDTEQGQAFMEELRQSGMVSEEEFSKIAYKNAESLLGIRVDSAAKKP